MRLTAALKAALVNAALALFGLGLTRATSAVPAAGMLVASLVPVLLIFTLARALRDLDGEHAAPEEQRAARLALALMLVPLVVLFGVLRQLTGHVLPPPPGL
ncbi:MAG TPA: hypothetical protein VF310_01075 [Vicinamibacteria bacterium]|jgi:hypothetical protein